MAIDIDVLNKVDEDYEKEQGYLQMYLNTTVSKLVGDTPINLSSPEQLSQVVYSYKFKDKKTWREVMNIGVDARGKPKLDKDDGLRFVKCVDGVPTYKTQAVKCPHCFDKWILEDKERWH